LDTDGLGDACDNDDDGDGVDDAVDNCPRVDNPSQSDYDNNGIGWACDDYDHDGKDNLHDNCPTVANHYQEDADGDGEGDACDNDDDDDGVDDEVDNCPFTKNPDQIDADSDTLGNACDNCPTVPNPDQKDCNNDGIGAACQLNAVEAAYLDETCSRPYWAEMNFFVHPADMVTLPGCSECGDWLMPDHEIRVTLTLPVGVSAQIVDGRGHVIQRLAADAAPVGIVPGPAQQILQFRPKASFQYRAPGSEDAAFEGTQYFLQIINADPAAPGFETNVSVEHVTGAL
jgi:hypothetical protein